MDEIARLQRWYLRHCDSDWEHGAGINISTLDNPGWSVSVNLDGTELDGKAFDEISVDITETDWVRIWVRDSKFEGFCGPEQLTAVLLSFLTWAEEP